jgi:hypothetical protein
MVVSVDGNNLLESGQLKQSLLRIRNGRKVRALYNCLNSVLGP